MENSKKDTNGIDTSSTKALKRTLGKQLLIIMK